MSAAGADDVDDSVAYFVEDMGYHGKHERTRAAYERVLREFESFLAERGVAGPAAADRRACLAWVASLREEYAESTVATYASYCNRFYAYMTQVGAFEANPMTLVVEEMDETIDADPTRREISVSRMRAFLDGVTHPGDRAVLLTLLKTGLRVGELCNLDLRDLNLAHGGARDAYPALGTRGRLDGRPDTLLVDADVSAGEARNGEVRSASNKRKRVTLLPVDGELRDALAAWLAVRPDARSDAEPLFCSTRDAWGARLTPEMVRETVRGYARDAGWYRTGGGASENVTPHYFRHFFTTHLRDRTGDRGVVKYLRGDVAADVIDTYTHNWGDRVRDVYLENVYSLA
ncbi:site-specific recombinase XerD [Halarchaeum rubridurum]|uniref:Integrase n=1 Tax=Halarchaeum rubridurum TaxID=489911 RepID=A0A830FUZ4_9EURY|nr:tyrosine-type recombinase/integrase [Halarchaeum rubridurum]MBP1953452.1 site-specific recombinase XerD [Halarchaeum rubridurum]GGM65157.1 integrase [Halarchaeum rubridurum]